MPSYMYHELTQRMPKILEPRYEKLQFENGDLIPTDTDLEPGMREIAYERFSEFGDADLMSDAGTNIPIVDISLEEDRYPVAALASGFPISFQEDRALAVNGRGIAGRSNIDRFDRRMAAARKVIAQRMNRILAFGRSSIGIQGFINNSLVTAIPPTTGAGGTAGAGSFGQATYQAMCDFFVDQVESITDNFVSEEPTTALISPAVNRRLGVQNPNGTKSVRQFLAEEYPDLEFVKVRELSNSVLSANGVTTSGVRDRMIFYPNKANVLHRHIESSIAQLVPEDYIRIDGLRKVYTLFSCFSGIVLDYPQDVRMIDVFVS